MVRPFIDRKGQSRGATSQKTSALASADLELVNAMGSHHWGGCGASEVGVRRLGRRKKDHKEVLFYISRRVRLGYLGKQSVVAWTTFSSSIQEGKSA